jgi:hypothetical protein
MARDNWDLSELPIDANDVEVGDYSAGFVPAELELNAERR